MTFTYRLSTALFAVSLILYGVVQWRQSTPIKSDADEEEYAPAFIAENLNTTMFNELGDLSHRVKAKRMEHYKDLEFTYFEFPQYTLYPKDKTAPWQVTSNEATLYKDNRLILEDRVRMIATDPTGLVSEIHCKYLELDLATNIITSEQTILIKGKDFNMYGSGLMINLNTKEMTLSEHVQTIYKKAAI